MTEIIVPPRQGMRILHETGPFDQSLAALTRADAHLWSIEELVRLRTELGDNHPASAFTSYVSDGVIFLKDHDLDILVVSSLYNPILRHPRSAMEAYRQGKEFYVDDESISALLEKVSPYPEIARQRGVFRFPRNGGREYERNLKYSFLGDSSGDIDISFYLHEEEDDDEVYAQQQERPFARALKFYGEESGMQLFVDDRELHSGDCTLGGVIYFSQELKTS